MLEEDLQSWHDTAVALGKRIDTIRKLHKKRQYINNYGEFYVCDHCTAIAKMPYDYPCPTVRIIEGDTDALYG